MCIIYITKCSQCWFDCMHQQQQQPSLKITDDFWWILSTISNMQFHHIYNVFYFIVYRHTIWKKKIGVFFLSKNWFEKKVNTMDRQAVERLLSIHISNNINLWKCKEKIDVFKWKSIGACTSRVVCAINVWKI